MKVLDMLEAESVPDNRAQNCITEAASSPPNLAWSAAVGKATLGKFGRLVERLMGEIVTLKRALNIEHLRVEESRQAAKIAEAKMEAYKSDATACLHDATSNKALLEKRDKQLEVLKAQVESEKQRATSAEEREREWRAEVEKHEKTAVEAKLYTALLEGRNSEMTKHWSGYGMEANRVVAELRKTISSVTEKRWEDDEKIRILKLLSNQQEEQLRQLKLEKERIDAAFVAYQEQQESMLRKIKIGAAAQEKQSEDILEESRKVLAELKWALGVKTNVPTAQ